MDVGIAEWTKKTNEELANMMWVLQGDNVAKCSFIVMNANIAWLVGKTKENFGRLMWVLWGENLVGCNMK